MGRDGRPFFHFSFGLLSSLDSFALFGNGWINGSWRLTMFGNSGSTDGEKWIMGHGGMILRVCSHGSSQTAWEEELVD